MITKLKFVPTVSKKDKVYWKEKGNGEFTTKSAIKLFRRHAQEVHWHQLVWFKKSSIPRFCFVAWLVCRKRLLTKDKLCKWGVEVRDTKCVLCGREKELHNHLFFECNLTATVLWKVTELCLVYRISMSWEEELYWLSKHCIQKNFC